MGTAAKVDGRTERGERTRRQILDAAVHIASVEGLEGLSIGGLALKLEMSKSGLFGAFGSKVDLQLATVDHAAEIFVEQVDSHGNRSGSGRVYGGQWRRSAMVTRIDRRHVDEMREVRDHRRSSGRQAMQPVFIEDVGRVAADCALKAEAANQL